MNTYLALALCIGSIFGISSCSQTRTRLAEPVLSAQKYILPSFRTPTQADYTATYGDVLKHEVSTSWQYHPVEVFSPDNLPITLSVVSSNPAVVEVEPMARPSSTANLWSFGILPKSGGRATVTLIAKDSRYGEVRLPLTYTVPYAPEISFLGAERGFLSVCGRNMMTKMYIRSLDSEKVNVSAYSRDAASVSAPTVVYEATDYTRDTSTFAISSTVYATGLYDLIFVATNASGLSTVKVLTLIRVAC